MIWLLSLKKLALMLKLNKYNPYFNRKPDNRPVFLCQKLKILGSSKNHANILLNLNKFVSFSELS